MAAMWDKLRTGNAGPGLPPPLHKQGRAHLDAGGGAARGAYYGPRGRGNTSIKMASASAHNARNAPSKGYSYSIRGGPAPPRPPREFYEQQQQQLDAGPRMQNHHYPPLHQQAPRHHNGLPLPARNPQRNSYRDSAHRPPSSIYSQPSPLNTNFSTSHHASYDGRADVSPPSSPEGLPPWDGPRQQQPHDISPIDEEPTQHDMYRADPSQQGGAPRGNIPMMRRERRQNQDTAARNLRESRSRERMREQQPPPPDQMLSRRRYEGGEVRWDPSTGELTSSDKGRPGQVKPAEYGKKLASGPPSSASAARQEEPPKGTTSLGERMRRMARGERPTEQPQASVDPAADAFASDRPAWKGASGRTALVAPVHDTPDVKPLNIPRKSSKRASRSPAPAAADKAPPGLDTIMASPPVSPPAGGETLGRDTIRQVVPSSQLPKQQQEPPAQAAGYPSPPLSGEHGQRGAAPSQSPQVPNSQIKRKPPPSHQQHQHHQQDSVSSSVYSQNDAYGHNNFSSSTGSAPPQPPPHNWDQPPSRFSVTTYDATPRESLDEFDPRDAPPLPPLHSSPGQKLQESMMDRRRPPKLGHTSPKSPGEEPIVISLSQPWMSQSHAPPERADRRPTAISRTNPLGIEARPTSMAGSVHKVLPPAPPETSAKDRVTQLNAQLAGLAQRRVNITRSIKQMTELMPTDNLMANAEVLHKREMEKRKVEGLKTELSEIQREEYEIGLKLHRAYKRLDRDTEYEPTTLWVRRVTG